MNAAVYVGHLPSQVGVALIVSQSSEPEISKAKYLLAWYHIEKTFNLERLRRFR